eukprot:2338338-Amphidinium_carterae.2
MEVEAIDFVSTDAAWSKCADSACTWQSSQSETVSSWLLVVVHLGVIRRGGKVEGNFGSGIASSTWGTHGVRCWMRRCGVQSGLWLDSLEDIVEEGDEGPVKLLHAIVVGMSWMLRGSWLLETGGSGVGPRTLPCLCVCPFHSLLELGKVRMGEFVVHTAGGFEVEYAVMIKALNTVMGQEKLTEHSMRSRGAQWHATRGMSLWAIKFIGRGV